MIRRLFIAVLWTLILSACVNDDEPEVRSLVVAGDPVPQFEVELSDGTPVSSQSLLGTWYVIAFFDTSCSDCRRELPCLEEFHLMRTELPLLCISRGEDAASVEAYWQANGFTMQYSAQSDATVYHRFATAGVPRVYIINSAGIVTAEYLESSIPAPEELAEMVP